MAAVQVIIDNTAATLKWHTDTRIIHHEWRQFVHGKDFRDTLWQGMETLKKNGGTKWLSDDRGNGALPADDEQWAKTQWFPAVKAAGWKHWAIVMPTKMLGQLNMKKFISEYAALGINTMAFDDPDKAYTWLAAQK